MRRGVFGGLLQWRVSSLAAKRNAEVTQQHGGISLVPGDAKFIISKCLYHSQLLLSAMTTIFLLQEMTWKTEESGVCADRAQNFRKGKVRLCVKLYEAAVHARSFSERASRNNTQRLRAKFSPLKKKKKPFPFYFNCSTHRSLQFNQFKMAKIN